MMPEFGVVNPTRCFDATCDTFLGGSEVPGPLATCGQCGKTTCRLCKSAMHAGTCDLGPDGAEVLEATLKEGGKQCPECGKTVLRLDGCSDMTCTCGMEFCYECGHKLSECWCRMTQDWSAEGRGLIDEAD